jgi:uncharacterized protein
MNAKQPPFKPHEVKDHLLRSNIVAQSFKIRVLQPIRRTDDSERFPVLYVTDSDEFFGGLATLASALQFSGETPRFILVGIGYENALAVESLRMRDLVTHAIRERYQRAIERVAESPLFGGIDDLEVVTHTTDAADFLRFIRAELMPFIAAEYPVRPGDNNYSGYSAGGTFGLYTLFTQPDTFRRYIIGSPSASHAGHHFGIELVKEFISSGQAMDAKVFISVGELEEFTEWFSQFELVTGYYLLVKFLKQSAIRGLDVTSQVFPGETHATAWTLAFSRGLKTLFGPADHVPYWNG